MQITLEEHKTVMIESISNFQREFQDTKGMSITVQPFHVISFNFFYKFVVKIHLDRSTDCEVDCRRNQ